MKFSSLLFLNLCSCLNCSSLILSNVFLIFQKHFCLILGSTHIYTQTYTNTHTHIFKHIHTYIYIYIYIYIYQRKVYKHIMSEILRAYAQTEKELTTNFATADNFQWKTAIAIALFVFL